MREPVEIYFDEILRETEQGDEQDGAYLFAIDDQEVWLPKSQVELVEPGIMEIPEWLAIEKELV